MISGAVPGIDFLSLPARYIYTTGLDLFKNQVVIIR